jgi:hypothetical protein
MELVTSEGILHCSVREQVGNYYRNGELGPNPQIASSYLQATQI